MSTHHGNICIDPAETIWGKGKGSHHKAVGSGLMNEVEEDAVPSLHVDLHNASITDVDQPQTTQSNDSIENTAFQVQEISSSNTSLEQPQTREERDSCREEDQETQLKMVSSDAAEGSRTNNNQMEDPDKIGSEKIRETSVKNVSPVQVWEKDNESKKDMEAKLEEKDREISQLLNKIMLLEKKLDEKNKSTNEETHSKHEESTTHSEVIASSNPAMELTRHEKDNDSSQEDHNETRPKTVSYSAAKTNDDSSEDSLQIGKFMPLHSPGSEDSAATAPSAEDSETTTLSDVRTTLEESITNRGGSSEVAVSSNVYQIDSCSSVVIGNRNVVKINANHFRNVYEAMTIAKLELDTEKEKTKQKEIEVKLKETEVKKLEAAKELFSPELFKDQTKLEQVRKTFTTLSMTPVDASEGSIILHLVTSDPKIFLEKGLGEIEQQLSEEFSKCLITQEMKEAVDFAELRVKTNITSVLFQRQGLEKLKETRGKCAELEAELEEKNKEMSQLREEMDRLCEEKGEISHQGDSELQLRKELDQKQKSDTRKPVCDTAEEDKHDEKEVEEIKELKNLLEEYKRCIRTLSYGLLDIFERIERRPEKMLTYTAEDKLLRIIDYTHILGMSSTIDDLRHMEMRLRHILHEDRYYQFPDEFVSFELSRKIAEDLCSGKGKHAEKLFDYLKSEDLSKVMTYILPKEKVKLIGLLRKLGRDDLISKYIELAEGDSIAIKLRSMSSSLISKTDPKKAIEGETVIKKPVHDDSQLGDDSMTH